jgi:hypothetical protein
MSAQAVTVGAYEGAMLLRTLQGMYRAFEDFAGPWASAQESRDALTLVAG